MDNPIDEDSENGIALLNHYDRLLKSMDVKSKRFAAKATLQDPLKGLSHARYMARKTKSFIKQVGMAANKDRIVFIQGILFTNGVITIEDIKNQT